MDMLRQCATLSTAVAKRLQDSVIYFDDGAAEAAMASFGAKLQQGWDPFRMLQVSATIRVVVILCVCNSNFLSSLNMVAASTRSRRAVQVCKTID